MSDTPTLRELAAIAPDAVGRHLRRAPARRCCSLAQEIDAITKSNRDLLQRGQQAAREALASLGEIDIDTESRSVCRSLAGLHLVRRFDPGAPRRGNLPKVGPTRDVVGSLKPAASPTKRWRT